MFTQVYGEMWNVKVDRPALHRDAIKLHILINKLGVMAMTLKKKEKHEFQRNVKALNSSSMNKMESQVNKAFSVAFSCIR